MFSSTSRRVNVKTMYEVINSTRCFGVLLNLYIVHYMRINYLTLLFIYLFLFKRIECSLLRDKQPENRNEKKQTKIPGEIVGIFVLDVDCYRSFVKSYS